MKLKKFFVQSVFSSLLAILFIYYHWKMVSFINAFPPVWILVFGFFGIITVLSFISFIKNRVWLPITIQVITIILLLTLPFTQTALGNNFKWSKSEREEVVKMVEKGEIKTNLTQGSSLIQLPNKYHYLSSGGGEIMAEKSGEGYNVFFFTYRGLDGASGFLYTPYEQIRPKKIFENKIIIKGKMDKNWYFVSLD